MAKRLSTIWLLVVVVAVMSSECTATRVANVETIPWGTVGDHQIYLYSVANANGTKLVMTNLGAMITSLFVPDRVGRLEDVVLGFDTPQAYLNDNQSIGGTIGRFANRIRGGRIVIDDNTYQLTTNEGANTLHGAGEFENVIWDAEIVQDDRGSGVRFRYLSPDGSHGFPGNLTSTVTMQLTADDALHIRYEAVTDKATHVNMTHHGYFNLNGARDLIHEHLVRIDADSYLVLDDEALTTGEVDTLDGKAWDLSTLTRLGDRMADIPRNGYHHNFVLNKADGQLERVAEVIEPVSGRRMDVWTTQPSVVFYASMGLNENIVGKYGIHYSPHIAFCLETQHHIDAPNHSDFPTTLLRPGEKYDETVIYDFGVVDEE